MGVHAGAIGAKRKLLEAILEQQEPVHEDVWNVATLQRRDVRTNAVFSSFKSKQEAEFGVSGNVRTRGGNQSRATSIWKKSP